MIPSSRTVAEEQEVTSAAVVSVLHSLMEITADKQVDVEIRIQAASHVLAWALETTPGQEEDFEEEEVSADDGSES